MEQVVKSPEQLEELGRKFAERLKGGDIVFLRGELGSGKTTFVRGVGRHFKVDKYVCSPSFTIVNDYGPIYHIDLYRLKSAQELEDIGLFEMLSEPQKIKLIEWPDIIKNSVEPDFIVEISELPEGRLVKIVTCKS